MLVAARRYPWLTKVRPSHVSAIVPILRLGGWMSVSNIMSPLMVSLDRFLIGSLLSMAAVTYYATPYEMVTKLSFIPGAVAAVFFPAFAGTYTLDRPRTALLMDRAGRLLVAMIFPAILVLSTFARETLSLWIGGDFAQQSSLVLQILAIGVFVNSFAQVPFAIVQATGRPDLTAKLHLLELPLYASLIYVLSKRLGIAGVALAWSLRMVIDTSLLCWLAQRLIPESAASVWRSVRWLLALSAITATLAVLDSLTVRALLAALILLGFAFAAWTRLLTAPERTWILGAIPKWAGAIKST
jgi:O-antigen/teichoic acid export membrane protein